MWGEKFKGTPAARSPARCRARRPSARLRPGRGPRRAPRQLATLRDADGRFLAPALAGELADDLGEIDRLGLFGGGLGLRGRGRRAALDRSFRWLRHGASMP